MRSWEECAAAGMTQAEAARHRGATASSASTYAKRHGLKFAHRSHASTDAWRACAEAGMGVKQAAVHLGRSLPAAYAAANRHGIKFAGRPVKPAPVRKYLWRWKRHLSESQLTDYFNLTQRCHYRKADALKALGREDLL